MVAALCQGEDWAFAELLDRYHPALLRLARLYVQDRSAAEDVVQETWLGVVRGIGRFEGRSSLRTWIFRILVNRARSRRRKVDAMTFSALNDSDRDNYEPAVDPARFGENGHWLVPPCSSDDMPEERLLADEMSRRVRRAVLALPPNQREVVTLRDVEGLTAAEVCGLLELGESNQRVLLHRGRSRVRAALEQYITEEHTLHTSTSRGGHRVGQARLHSRPSL